jgi:hypothetical protein
MFCVLALLSQAQEPAKYRFDLPADLAARTFKLFSVQSGRGLIADADLVREVRTNVVQGEFTPAEAAARLLAGTGLAAQEDPKNGAFVIHRKNPASAGPHRAAAPAPTHEPDDLVSDSATLAKKKLRQHEKQNSTPPVYSLARPRFGICTELSRS